MASEPQVEGDQSDVWSKWYEVNVLIGVAEIEQELPLADRLTA